MEELNEKIYNISSIIRNYVRAVKLNTEYDEEKKITILKKYFEMFKEIKAIDEEMGSSIIEILTSYIRYSGRAGSFNPGSKLAFDFKDSSMNDAKFLINNFDKIRKFFAIVDSYLEVYLYYGEDSKIIEEAVINTQNCTSAEFREINDYMQKFFMDYKLKSNGIFLDLVCSIMENRDEIVFPANGKYNKAKKSMVIPIQGKEVNIHTDFVLATMINCFYQLEYMVEEIEPQNSTYIYNLLQIYLYTMDEIILSPDYFDKEFREQMKDITVLKDKYREFKHPNIDILDETSDTKLIKNVIKYFLEEKLIDEREVLRIVYQLCKKDKLSSNDIIDIIGEDYLCNMYIQNKISMEQLSKMLGGMDEVAKMAIEKKEYKGILGTIDTKELIRLALVGELPFDTIMKEGNIQWRDIEDIVRENNYPIDKLEMLNKFCSNVSGIDENLLRICKVDKGYIMQSARENKVSADKLYVLYQKGILLDKDIIELSEAGEISKETRSKISQKCKGIAKNYDKEGTDYAAKLKMMLDHGFIQYSNLSENDFQKLLQERLIGKDLIISLFLDDKVPFDIFKNLNIGTENIVDVIIKSNNFNISKVKGLFQSKIININDLETIYHNVGAKNKKSIEEWIQQNTTVDIFDDFRNSEIFRPIMLEKLRSTSLKALQKQIKDKDTDERIALLYELYNLNVPVALEYNLTQEEQKKLIDLSVNDEVDGNFVTKLFTNRRISIETLKECNIEAETLLQEIRGNPKVYSKQIENLISCGIINEENLIELYEHYLKEEKVDKEGRVLLENVKACLLGQLDNDNVLDFCIKTFALNGIEEFASTHIVKLPQACNILLKLRNQGLITDEYIAQNLTDQAIKTNTTLLETDENKKLKELMILNGKLTAEDYSVIGSEKISDTLQLDGKSGQEIMDKLEEQYGNNYKMYALKLFDDGILRVEDIKDILAEDIIAKAYKNKAIGNNTMINFYIENTISEDALIENMDEDTLLLTCVKNLRQNADEKIIGILLDYSSVEAYERFLEMRKISTGDLVILFGNGLISKVDLDVLYERNLISNEDKDKIFQWGSKVQINHINNSGVAVGEHNNEKTISDSQQVLPAVPYGKRKMLFDAMGSIFSTRIEGGALDGYVMEMLCDKNMLILEHTKEGNATYIIRVPEGGLDSILEQIEKCNKAGLRGIEGTERIMHRFDWSTRMVEKVIPGWKKYSKEDKEKIEEMIKMIEEEYKRIQQEPRKND